MAWGPVHRLGALVAAIAAMSAPAVLAQDLKLVGLDGQSLALTATDIAALPHVDLTVTVEGKTEAYRGVPLATLLARVGAPLGKALKGQELRDVVLVGAKDGYAAAFALAETDPMERQQAIILADAAGGQPLPPTQGPYRIVVDGDQRGARLVRMVTTIELRRVEPAK